MVQAPAAQAGRTTRQAAEAAAILCQPENACLRARS